MNSGSTTKTITNSSVTFSSAASNFYGGSAKFSSASLATNSSADFNFGTGNFTVECWIYLLSQGTGSYNHYLNISSQDTFAFKSGSTYFYLYANSGVAVQTSNAPPLNKWTHLALVRNGSTLTIYVDGIASGSNSTSASFGTTAAATIGAGTGAAAGEYLDGYMSDVRVYKGLAKYTQNFIPASTDPDILPDTPSGVSYTSNLTQITDGAVAFDGSGDYLSLASSSDFNIGSNAASLELFVYLNSVSSSQVFNGQNSGANSTIRLGYWTDSGNIGFSYTVNDDTRRGKVLGAAGKWYHLLATITGGTGRFFIDGVLQSYDTGLGSVQSLNETYYIGAEGVGESQLNGFISNFHFVNGSIPTQYQTSATTIGTQVFTPPTGPITSVANTKLLCCKSQTSATAFDVSPGTITANGNVAASNFNPFTVNINTQRGQESGWCTLNPLRKSSGSTEPTISEGNLTITAYTASNTGWCNGGATIDINSGKWYWEVYPRTVGGSGLTVGIASEGYEWNRDTAATGLPWLGSQTGTSWSVYSTGQKYFGASGTNYMNAFTSSDTVGVAFDMDAQTLTYYLNGVSQGVAFSGVNAGGKSIQVGISVHTSGSNKASINFGQKPFKFPPPAGFQPLALANTPRPSIVRPDQYMGVTTYTGNGTSQSINVGWKPDLVWVKCRSANNSYHSLYDTVRGSYKRLSSNAADAEYTYTTTGVTTFSPFGFTVADDGAGSDNVNGAPGGTYSGSTAQYVAWGWKAGGNSNTYNINDVGYATASAAGLNAGTITPTGASVNTKSGFSIITYSITNASSSISTFSHGLNNTPSFVILKVRNAVDTWTVYHNGISNPNSNWLTLNATDAAGGNTSTFSSSSTTFGVRETRLVASGGSGNVVAYLWAEIPGFSKFGSYTGNNSTDGPVIITGFRPRWIIIKRTDSSDDWQIRDTTINTYNPMQKTLFANLSQAEVTLTDRDYDILSNGFKIRGTDVEINASGGTYIYAAFAETPSFNLYGAQANAR